MRRRSTLRAAIGRRAEVIAAVWANARRMSSLEPRDRATDEPVKRQDGRREENDEIGQPIRVDGRARAIPTIELSVVEAKLRQPQVISCSIKVFAARVWEDPRVIRCDAGIAGSRRPRPTAAAMIPHQRKRRLAWIVKHV